MDDKLFSKIDWDEIKVINPDDPDAQFVSYRIVGKITLDTPLHRVLELIEAGMTITIIRGDEKNILTLQKVE